MKNQYRGPATATEFNGQPIEKVQRTFDGTLEVHSIFKTIQGEGPFCGTPAVFIRLAGCNLQCPWCDTEYTNGRRVLTIEEVLAEVHRMTDQTHTRLVVITGGEPFRQVLGELLHGLIKDDKYYVQIETNGTLPTNAHPTVWAKNTQARAGVYIVCSPKTGRVHPTVAAAACCYKYVLTARDIAEDDGLPLHALGHVANPRLARPPAGFSGAVYVQPADMKDEYLNQENMDAAIKSAMGFGYTIQLQIHKYLNME